MDDLDRYVALERRLIERLSTDVVPFAHGVAYLDRRHPLRFDSNFLIAQRPLGDVAASELLEAADRILGGAGLAHREVVVNDDADGARLAPFFVEAGYEATADATMRLGRRPPDRESELQAEECPYAEVRALIEEGYRREHGSEEIVRSFGELRGSFEQVIGARFFVARVDGVPAGSCELYPDGDDAQVEHVATLEEYRGRGVARAVVLAAARAAVAGGARHVFIVADDGDWPKHLYERLGFEHIGRTWQFLREP